MLVEHIVWSPPAPTVAAGYIVTTIASFTAGHGPAGSFVVRVRVTVPAVMSAALGVYVVFRFEALAKLPLPEVVHTDEAALPPLVPVRVTTGEDEQTS